MVAVQEGFEDTYFADDLNLFRSFPSTTGNHTVTAALDDCQKSLHQWGELNQVEFDSGKESKHILHNRRPWGENFKILGMLFDTKLTMVAQCQEVAVRAGWKSLLHYLKQEVFSTKGT